MSKISDELRAAGNMLLPRGSYGHDTIMALADRIDAEMVELPRDANDEPIHLGDTLYDLDGYKHTAVSLRLYGEEDLTWTVSVGGGSVYPRDLTYECPDSLERIVDELDDWRKEAVEECRIMTSDNDDMHDFIDRIRKLAKEQGE